MKTTFAAKQNSTKYFTEHIWKPDVIGAVQECLEELAAQEQLKRMGLKVFEKYKHIFEPIPHVDELPMDVYCQIQLKDTTKLITTRTYSSPQKYCEAWCTLIQHHEDAGWIHPSNLSSASPSFVVPKTDPTVLPRWVNDYQILNLNTVLDSYPLPCVHDIPADCAQGWIWSWLDIDWLWSGSVQVRALFS